MIIMFLIDQFMKIGILVRLVARQKEARVSYKTSLIIKD